MYSQVLESIIVPLLQERWERKEKCCDTASGKFSFDEWNGLTGFDVAQLAVSFSNSQLRCCSSGAFCHYSRRLEFLFLNWGICKRKQGKRMTSDISKQLNDLVSKRRFSKLLCYCPFSWYLVLFFCKGKSDPQRPFHWGIQGHSENDKTSHSCHRPSTIPKVSQSTLRLHSHCRMFGLCQHAAKSCVLTSFKGGEENFLNF